jgi:hypothetical protein
MLTKNAAYAITAVMLSSAASQAASPPTSVAPPKAINLGSTSFFDGFGRTVEGFTWLQYGRFEDLTHITDYQGHDSTLFKGTRVSVFVSQTQVSYTSPWHPFGGDGVGVTALASFADFSSHFDATSPVKLSNHHFGFGDFNIGPFYQSRIFTDEGRPFLAFRTQFSVIAPTGNVDTTKNINQGAGFWGINPYLSITYVPFPKLEFSTRINYQYNLKTSVLENPPAIPHFVYHSGQAGDIMFGNLDASYAVLPNAYIGINAFALGQLSPNRTNGQNVSHSLETLVYLGPGARYVFSQENALNVNLYQNVVSRNATTGTVVNFQFVHRF